MAKYSEIDVVLAFICKIKIENMKEFFDVEMTVQCDVFDSCEFVD